MSEELQVSSSTDTQNIVTAVADGEDGRAAVADSSLSKFEQSADGKVVSYENEQSERQSLLERLREAEQEIEFPVEKADTESSEEGQAVDESELGIDMAAVRKAATEDAIAAARARQQYYSQQQQQHLAAPDVERLIAQLAVPFAERMQALRAQTPDIAELDKQSNIPIPLAVQDALLALSGGPEATIYLIRHPEEARQLQHLPEHVAVAKVAQLTARLTTPPRRARSNAPEPISPVGGSATRSSLPADELPYQEFARMRERQIKGKYRR